MCGCPRKARPPRSSATPTRSRRPARKPGERSRYRGRPCSPQRRNTTPRQHAGGRELLRDRGNPHLSAGREHPRSPGGNVRPHSQGPGAHALERHRRAGQAVGLSRTGRFREVLRRSRRAHGADAPRPAGHEPHGRVLRQVRPPSGGATSERRGLIPARFQSAPACRTCPDRRTSERRRCTIRCCTLARATAGGRYRP